MISQGKRLADVIEMCRDALKDPETASCRAETYWDSWRQGNMKLDSKDEKSNPSNMEAIQTLRDEMKKYGMIPKARSRSRSPPIEDPETSDEDKPNEPGRSSTG